MRLPARKEPGRCRHCGCTEQNACRFERGLTCSWVIPGEICSNRDCVQAEIDRLFALVETPNGHAVLVGEGDRVMALAKAFDKPERGA